MISKDFLRDLTNFFKAARHLWGRCPTCGELFRLSDAAISFGSQPPQDWLRAMLRQKTMVIEKSAELKESEEELASREADVLSGEHDLNNRAKHLNREIKQLAYEYLKSDARISKLIRQTRKDAILKSRATLLGKLFERLAPFFQKFNHDPRDIRPLMDPVDYICFDGLTVDRRVSKITFVEVKSGTGSLSPSERSIIEAVRNQRVTTEVWHFGHRKIPLQQQLLLSNRSIAL